MFFPLDAIDHKWLKFKIILYNLTKNATDILKNNKAKRGMLKWLW